MIDVNAYRKKEGNEEFIKTPATNETHKRWFSFVEKKRFSYNGLTIHDKRTTRYR